MDLLGQLRILEKAYHHLMCCFFFYWQGVNLTCSHFLLKRKFCLIFIPVRTILICYVSEKNILYQNNYMIFKKKNRFEFGSDISQSFVCSIILNIFVFSWIVSFVDVDIFFHLQNSLKDFYSWNLYLLICSNYNFFW